MISEPQKTIGLSDLCFGCGKDNPHGLKLKIKWDGKTARAEFTPNKFHQGFSDIIHGGIINTILDETMGNAAYNQGLKCFTATMQTRFKRPLSVGEPTIVTAWVTKKARRLVETKAKLTLKDGTLIAECQAMQLIPSTEPDER